MLRRRHRASRGLRWSLLGVAAVVACTVISDPTEARARRKQAERAAPPAQLEPRYADIVVDANNGAVLHATNADALRHPASLTKVMTLYLLFERLEAGKLTLDSELDVSAHAAVQAPTKLGLRSAAQLAHFALSHGIAPAPLFMRTNEDHAGRGVERQSIRS